MQPTLLIEDAPEAVIKVFKRLEAARLEAKDAEKKKGALELNLEEAFEILREKNGTLSDTERDCFMVCCQALLKELEGSNRGYCHACGALVPFEGHIVGYLTTIVHVSAVSEREYRDAEDARDDTHYHYYHTPHKCPKLSRVGKEAYQKGKEACHRGYRDYHIGGTIANAPEELFAQYGIPSPSPEMLEKYRVTPWDFPHEVP